MNRFVTYGIHRVWPAWQASKREGDGREREKGMGPYPSNCAFPLPSPSPFFVFDADCRELVYITRLNSKTFFKQTPD